MNNKENLKTAFRTLADKNRLAKHYIKKKLAQDAGEHWVTVNAGSKEGGEGGGSHVLLDGEGRVIAGMGGKFKGQNIDRIERKKFINQNAWGRQRKALTEKAGNDTVLKRAVTAGMRSQAEKEADTSNDKWQKEGLYKAITRKTLQENKGIINVLHDYVDRMNAKSKTPNPIAEKIQKQSDGVKQIVTEAITKYNDLEAVNQLRDIPDGVDVVTEKGQFFKTGDLWSSPDGKKTLEHDQMFRQLKKELKSQISNKDMDNLVANELEKVQYKDVAEQVEKAEREKAEKAERKERSKDFYLNKIDKIKDSMNKGENYSSDLYKSELYKSLLSKANHGNVEEVNRVLNELKKEGIYTDKHRIWRLADVAKKNADYIAERHEKAAKTTTALKGATVNKEIYNGEARTSVKFDNIPNYATRVALKQNGFKWNADAGEWYKSEGENGAAHERIINALKDQGFNEQPKAETPTAQPRQATPTQQAEGKQYEGTGIENKNGRFEVSFNAFPSYKLRTDMKNNGFKWDPNTKVWHTTDREKLDQVLSRHFTERT